LERRRGSAVARKVGKNVNAKLAPIYEKFKERGANVFGKEGVKRKIPPATFEGDGNGRRRPTRKERENLSNSHTQRKVEKFGG